MRDEANQFLHFGIAAMAGMVILLAAYGIITRSRSCTAVPVQMHLDEDLCAAKNVNGSGTCFTRRK